MLALVIITIIMVENTEPAPRLSFAVKYRYSRNIGIESTSNRMKPHHITPSKKLKTKTTTKTIYLPLISDGRMKSILILTATTLKGQQINN